MVSVPLVSLNCALTSIVWMAAPTFMATQLKALACSVVSMSLMLSLLLSNIVVRVNSRLQNTTCPLSLGPAVDGRLPDAPVVDAGGTTNTGLPSSRIDSFTVAEYIDVVLPWFVIWLRMVHSEVTEKTRSAGFDVLIWAFMTVTVVFG